jgi:hypothetical protein
VNAAPLVAPLGCVVIANWVAAPAVPVALNVTGLPVRPAADAVTVFAPAVVPNVQLVSVAIPLAFVTTVLGDTVPPPAVAANVTVTPATGAEAASVTNTLGAVVTAVPATADCVTTEFAAIVVAPDAATVNDDEVAFVSAPDVKRIVCAPLPVMTKLVNVATPFTAFTITVPVSAPVPLKIAAVTAAVLEV